MISHRALIVVGILGPAWLIPLNEWVALWLLLWGAFWAACRVRFALRAEVVRRYGQPPECLRIDDPFRRRTRRTFSLVTLVVLTRAPFVVALLVSRPWLDHQAYYVWAVLPSNVEPRQSPGLQGLVMVRRIDAGPTHVTFHLLGGAQITYRPAPNGQGLECTRFVFAIRDF